MINFEGLTTKIEINPKLYNILLNKIKLPVFENYGTYLFFTIDQEILEKVIITRSGVTRSDIETFTMRVVGSTKFGYTIPTDLAKAVMKAKKEFN